MPCAIYILHKPTNNRLCNDGVFRGFYSCCGTKDDTKVYRRSGPTMKRLNSRVPGKSIHNDMVDDCVLEVVWSGGCDSVHYVDRHGVRSDS